MDKAMTDTAQGKWKKWKEAEDDLALQEKCQSRANEARAKDEISEFDYEMYCEETQGILEIEEDAHAAWIKATI